MKIIITFFSLILILASEFAQGQTRTITGSGNWSTTGNWAGGNIGGAVDNDDDIVQNQNTDIVIQTGESYTVASFEVGKDGSLTIETGGTLIITGAFLADKDFILNVNGDLTIQGTLDVAKSLILNVTGNLLVEGDILAAKDAVVDVQGAVDVLGDFITDKDAVVNVDGTLDVAGDLDLGAGSVITGSGPVTAGTCSGSACGDGQLPVELLYFNIEVTEGASKAVKSQWATSTEENNDYFNVERSRDGITYQVIATIAGAGNSTDIITYEYQDDNPLFGQSYYRLKQTDYDGVNETFDAKSVYVSSLEEVVAFPNPAVRGEKLSIYSNAEDGEDVSMSIYSSAGAVVMTRNLVAGNNDLILDNQLQTGFYILKVKSGDKQIIKRLLVK